MSTSPSSRGRESADTELTPGTSRGTSRGSSRSSSTSSRPKIYRCDYDGCDKLYSRPSLLTQHQRTHTDSRPFQCGMCGSAFFRESHLKRHMLSHTEEKPFKCAVCGKGVNTKQHLKRHEVTHTKSFKCDHEGCEECFYKHQQLRHHVQSVHLKLLTCKECGKTFPRPYRLANHMTKHHGASPAYQCDFPGCLKNVKTWSALQFHMKTDHPKLLCDVCGKGCVGQEGLRMHMLVHDEEKSLKRWKCTECPTEFAKKEELLIHYSNIHKFIPNSVKTQLLKASEPPKILSTEKVESILIRESAMDILLSTVQEPPQLLQCQFKNCTRTFKREFDLTRHLEWHEKKRELYAAKGLLMVSTGDEDVSEDDDADDDTVIEGQLNATIATTSEIALT